MVIEVTETDVCMDAPAVVGARVSECRQGLVDVCAGTGILQPSELVPRLPFGDAPPLLVRSGIRERLVRASRALPPTTRLVVVSAFRSYRDQKRLHRHQLQAILRSHPDLALPDAKRLARRFVADPGVYAPHVTGGAVDVLLANAEHSLLDMGGNFAYDETARLDCRTLSAQQCANRQVLSQAMSHAGFVNYAFEWWHWSFGEKHTACSAAALLYPETLFNLARTGIAMYGLWPSKETLAIARSGKAPHVELKPVLAWKTVIGQIKDVKKGTPVSYGLTERVAHDSRIAVIPVGYWDGFDRRLSGVATVLVHGQRCKVMGRICMGMCMIDVTDVPGVRIDDEVVLLGSQKNGTVSAEDLASKAGTINYEIVARINPTLPRLIVR